MRTKIFLISVLLLGAVKSYSQTVEVKKNTKAFIDKYEGFYVEWKSGDYTYSWKWHFEVQDEYRFVFKPEYSFNGKVDPYKSGEVFSFIPSFKEQQYKGRKPSTTSMDEIVFYRKTLDGANWTEYVAIEIYPNDQAQFIKDLKLVYQDFGATLTEKKD